ncbi:MAG: DUF2236 domain-containing protein [Acidimicrobiia bacterium]|nr:DUF2236 domain-containing protein [Acidimicrobiia bacterium]
MSECLSSPVPTVELGPSSLLWRYAGDTRIAFLGGTIGLLQLMYPAIGAGVLEHSNFFEDPADRVFRSLPRILGAVYDGVASYDTGRQIRDFHRSIRGTDAAGRRYHALDPATFWWAHATFQFMAEQVADRFDRHRLSIEERERLYLEGVAWYRRYGVSDRIVPHDRAGFQAEWDRVCTEVLEMNEAVRFVLSALDAPLPPMGDRAAVPAPLRPVADQPLVRRLLRHPSRLVAVGGLPAAVRERFGIRWTSADQVQLQLIEQTVARTWRFLPPTVRWQPSAYAAWQRERGTVP